MSIKTLIAVRNGIGSLFIVMLIIIIFMYIRYWIVGYIEERKWDAWKCPFPAGDGYTEYGIDDMTAEYRRQMKKNALLAAEKYEGKRVTLKGLVQKIYPDGGIVIKDISERGDSSITCNMQNGGKMSNVIRQLICGKSVVYIRGQIISGKDIAVRIDDIALYED